MIINEFEITVTLAEKSFRMRVEQTYNSEHLQRFIVYGKNRKLVLEKHPKMHGEKWKIREGADLTNKRIEDVTFWMMMIFDKIDKYLDENKDYGTKPGTLYDS